MALITAHVLFNDKRFASQTFSIALVLSMVESEKFTQIP
jgi:hypothetical protein